MGEENMWTILLLFSVTAASNGLSCSYSCDNPTCEPNCRPLCDTPVCEVVCPDPSHVTTCLKPLCQTQCPSDQLVTEGCPMCETICPKLMCAHDGCTIQCAPTNCNWECTAPTNCPQPQCEQPACAAPLRSASASHLTGATLCTIIGLCIVILL